MAVIIQIKENDKYRFSKDMSCHDCPFMSSEDVDYYEEDDYDPKCVIELNCNLQNIDWDEMGIDNERDQIEVMKKNCPIIAVYHEKSNEES